TINAVADIADDSDSTSEDMAVTTNVLANDTFEDAGAAVTGVTQGAHGSVVNNGDSTVTYTPNADYNGSDSYTYTVTSGGVTETATVNVTINPVADAVNDTATTNAGTPVTTNVLANDNFEGSPVVTNASNGAHGTVTFNGTSTTYTPAAGYSGPDSYTYTVTSGGVTETATVNVTVNAANSLYFRVAVSGPEGQDDLTFANFTVTIAGKVYTIADLVVVSQTQYFGNANGFHLGPGGNGSREVIFRLDGVPANSGAASVQFNYTSSNNGNTTDDGPVFGIGTTQTTFTTLSPNVTPPNYSNTAGWVG